MPMLRRRRSRRVESADVSGAWRVGAADMDGAGEVERRRSAGARGRARTSAEDNRGEKGGRRNGPGDRHQPGPKAATEGRDYGPGILRPRIGRVGFGGSNPKARNQKRSRVAVARRLSTGQGALVPNWLASVCAPPPLIPHPRPLVSPCPTKEGWDSQEWVPAQESAVASIPGRSSRSTWGPPVDLVALVSRRRGRGNRDRRPRPPHPAIDSLGPRFHSFKRGGRRIAFPVPLRVSAGAPGLGGPVATSLRAPIAGRRGAGGAPHGKGASARGPRPPSRIRARGAQLAVAQSASSRM